MTNFNFYVSTMLYNYQNILWKFWECASLLPNYQIAHMYMNSNILMATRK